MEALHHACTACLTRRTARNIRHREVARRVPSPSLIPGGEAQRGAYQLLGRPLTVSPRARRCMYARLAELIARGGDERGRAAEPRTGSPPGSRCRAVRYVSASMVSTRGHDVSPPRRLLGTSRLVAAWTDQYRVRASELADQRTSDEAGKVCRSPAWRGHSTGPRPSSPRHRGPMQVTTLAPLPGIDTWRHWVWSGPRHRHALIEGTAPTRRPTPNLAFENFAPRCDRVPSTQSPSPSRGGGLPCRTRWCVQVRSFSINSKSTESGARLLRYAARQMRSPRVRVIITVRRPIIRGPRPVGSSGRSGLFPRRTMVA